MQLRVGHDFGHGSHPMNRHSILVALLSSLALLASVAPGAAAAEKKPVAAEEKVEQQKSGSAPQRAASSMRLVREGKRLYLDLGAAPKQVEVLVDGRVLERIPGRGKTRFDLTPYLDKASKGRLTVRALDARGVRSVRSFDVAAHQKALLPASARAKATRKVAPKGPATMAAERAPGAYSRLDLRTDRLQLTGVGGEATVPPETVTRLDLRTDRLQLTGVGGEATVPPETVIRLDLRTGRLQLTGLGDAAPE
jgi:hypothetical protein